jgi:riboflavin biosynthesis pyrimidine reductase
VRALKSEPGGDMSLGGAETAAAFMAQGLLDGFHIAVHPVIVGAGQLMFDPATTTAAQLELVESRRFGNGVVLLRYDVAR